MGVSILERRLLNIREASELLSLSRATLYEFTAQRRIPFIRVGGRALRFDLLDLQKWIDRQRVPAKEEESLE